MDIWRCEKDAVKSKCCLNPALISVGLEGFTSQEDQEMISRIEKQLKRRFAIGSQVSEHSIVQDFTKQVSMLWW